MQRRAEFIHIKRKTILFVAILVIAITVATPAMADYLGPNRTVTEWSSTCKIILLECQYVPSKNAWRYKKVDDWSCSLESKPWQSYPDQPSSQGCFAATEGDQYWERIEVLQEITTTHPPATITGILQNCTVQNGWCVTVPQLDLSASEPLLGYNILAIEGTLNGQTFACPDANCSVTLDEGDNDFAFWALSSWGDSSTMGTLSAKVDSISPTVGLDLIGSNGTNGWFTSQTTVSATGADSGSGLAEASLSVDGGVWQSSTILNEGVYNVSVRAIDNAGNVSTSSKTISIDTTTPSLSVSPNGTMGANGWYKSIAQFSAVATDATSGVGSLEISLDGGTYQVYSSPFSFSDGSHSVQFRATDHAGNVTESAVQRFSVDTVPPEIFVLETWALGESSAYRVQDLGSGLASLRIVIEDEDERFPKVAWNEDVSGEKFKGYIEWDGKFKDGTVAPPATYFAWIKAVDIAGNEYVALGRIVVPEPNSILRLFQPASGSSVSSVIPTPPSELFEDDDQFSPTVQPIQNSSATGSLVFGGLSAQVGTSNTQSLVLNAGMSSTTPASSNVLWGATAAAVLGAATAYALEERRRRKEAEEAQRAEVVARIEAMEAQREAAIQAGKVAQWLEGQELLNEQIEKAKLHGANEEEIALLRKVGATQGFGKAIESARSLTSSFQRTRAEVDRGELEKELSLLKKLAESNPHDRDVQDQLAGLAAYYEATRQGERQAAKPSWWQKGLDWIDNNQIEIALGIGIVVGVGAIILSGGIATPLVAAAWVVGAAAVAGGTVALGTVGLNAYYQRPLGTNVLRNMGYAASAAAITATVGFVLNAVAAPVTRAVGTFCTAHITTCAVAAPAFKAVDYGWTGYDVWQANRTLSSPYASLDAKLIASVDIGLAAWSEGLEPDEALAISLPLDDVIRRELRYEFAEILEQEGKDAAFAYLKRVLGDVPFSKLGVLEDDVLEYAASQGPDALRALSAWTEKDLKEHGVELALRAKQDGEALKDLETLISKGPINPNKLTSEQEKLIKAIASNSTQYDEAGQIVLGKWVDYDNGFTEVARNTGSAHYNPHPDMWNLLGELGDEQRELTAWLINKEVIQNGIEKGLPFEYTFDGILAKDIVSEQKAIQLIFSNATESEIKLVLRSDYVPIRIQELQELKKAGYKFAVDDLNGSIILSLP